MLATVAVIAIAAAGGVAAELRWPDRAASFVRSLLVVSLYTLVPFVVFFNLARVEFTVDVGIGLALGWVAILCAAGLAWLIARRLLDLGAAATGAVIVCTLVPNSGYLGYPLTGSLLGLDALGEAVVYDVVVAAPSLLLLAFAIGAAYGSRAGETVRHRVIAFFTRNPPLYAAIAALLAPDALAPDALVDISRAAVFALLPIGFFAVGAVLAEEAEEGRLTLGSPISPPVAATTILRLVIAPGLLYLLALPLIDLPGPYLLLAAMPVGINPLIVAHVYGLDIRLTAQAIAWSTAIVIVAALGSLAL